MAILPIRIYGDPVLRKKCEPITEITPELRQLAKDMLETMYDAPGCGLAAPQIGKNIRLVVIDTAIPDEEEPRPYIMFNPEWEAEPDAKNVDYDEGCLSLPEIFCNVVRPDRVTVRFFDINVAKPRKFITAKVCSPVASSTNATTSTATSLSIRSRRRTVR